jgi:hypothetical protein
MRRSLSANRRSNLSASSSRFASSRSAFAFWNVSASRISFGFAFSASRPAASADLRDARFSGLAVAT